MKNRVLFFDRDGTVIVDTGYPSKPDDVALLPDAAQSLYAIQQSGFRLALISNQSGVGRGYFTETEMWNVHHRMASLLNAQGISIDEVHYCTSAPWDRDANRKPSPAMILTAARRLDADLRSSFMIGDKITDVQAGNAAGCRSILFQPQSREAVTQQNTLVCRNWREATRIILNPAEAK